jgi:hypothetical protein
MYFVSDAWDLNYPLKMWATDTSQASYVIYTDPNRTVKYRYQRDAERGPGTEVIAPDQDPPLLRTIASGTSGAQANDTVDAWRHQMREPAQTTVQTGITGTVVPRTTGSFQTGVEFIDFWRPAWKPLVRPSVTRLKSKNVKWVQIAAVWGITNADPTLIELGWNGFPQEDLIDHIREVKGQGLSVALKAFPFEVDSAVVTGIEQAHSIAWFDQYFDELKSVFLYHAKIAQQEGVELLILPNRYSWYEDVGRPADNPSTRAHINGKWKNIITEIRAIAPSVKLACEGVINVSPEYDWFGDLDYLGDKWWVPIAKTDSATVSEMLTIALDTLTTRFLPMATQFNKPWIITELAYHSANTSAMNTDVYGVYAPEISAFLPAVALPPSDHDEQARAYQAVLLAFAATPWVQGVYSFGYWYYDMDSKEFSIRSKTAENVMSQFYKRFNDVSGPMSSLNLASGWNLIGNSVNAPLDVTTSLADASKVTSVWKWVSTGAGKWAFFSPLQSDGAQAYAVSKGYDVLTTINAGEGFWVNANTAFTAQLPAGSAVTSTSFQIMSAGWHLISTGDAQTPSGFNTDLSLTPLEAGVVPQNITSLWTWDNAQSKWYFYAPSLEASGGTALTDYINSHDYLDFGDSGRLLGSGVGFWVNKPAP